jgi:CRP-like cAMP-binding protein
MVFWGIGMALSDAAAQGLLNRVVRVRDLPRAVAAIESTKLFAEGVGALAVPALVAVLDVRGGLIASGGAALLAVVADLPGLLRIEWVATARLRVLELVRGVELFVPLKLDARRLGPGDALGEIGVLHQIPRTASVVARTQVTALEIPGAELRSVLAEDGAAAPSAG